jgi:hypothetical protein
LGHLGKGGFLSFEKAISRLGSGHIFLYSSAGAAGLKCNSLINFIKKDLIGCFEPKALAGSVIE